MNYILILYTAYLIVTIILTVWVAHTLFKNGQVFLIDIFHGNKELAEAVNNLLWVGFYLVNIGYAVYTLKTYDVVGDARQLVEVLSLKLGAIILILGGMHFMNMFIFFRLRKRALIDKRPGGGGYDYRNDPENLGTYRVNIPNE
ncbi:hypothetical protein [Flavipsychrobacter stenotrophus]|uniref:hypothetical protein n=1 Tax=Flavipsychrobacter stenotrophus TaxID=2077091 RepID=UPI00196A8389|nr:hypothetical protein [Flavipsychrobacter stenotrophus]